MTFGVGTEQTSAFRASEDCHLSGTADRSANNIVSAWIVDNPVRTSQSVIVRERSPAEELFDATAEAKIWASKVAMHLPKEVRDRIFRQIDLLHDPVEWMEGDAPLKLNSFKSLVRSLIFFDMKDRPSLALLPNGRVMALWTHGESRLTVDFMNDDMVRWAVATTDHDVTERATGLTHLTRLQAVLAPYDAGRWFNGS